MFVCFYRSYLIKDFLAFCSVSVPRQRWLTLWLMILGGLPKVSPIQRSLFLSPDPNAGIYVRHGPESQTVFIAFSCAFLIKVRRGVAWRVVSALM